MNNQKGITLVALIITIIVMLILAGVSISLVVGENGVLTQAENAGTQTEEAEAEQAVSLAFADLMMQYYGATTEAAKEAVYTKTNVEKAIKDNGAKSATVTLAEGATAVTKDVTTITVNELTITVDIEESTTGALKLVSAEDTTK